MGNGALPNGPSYRAYPRLYQSGHTEMVCQLSAFGAKRTCRDRGACRFNPNDPIRLSVTLIDILGAPPIDLALDDPGIRGGLHGGRACRSATGCNPCGQRKRRHPIPLRLMHLLRPLGRRDGTRASEITPAMAAKLPSRTITSRPAAKSCCASAWRVLWPEPVRTASRHTSSEDAAATPILMPHERTTFRSPPASPVRDAGAAATTALLLGEMKSPWPIPKTARASITSGRLAGAPSSTAKSSTSATTQMSMPDPVRSRGPSRS